MIFSQYLDINECSSGTDNCAEQASCVDTDGSFTCTCNTGYTGDAVACTGMVSLEIYSPYCMKFSKV